MPCDLMQLREQERRQREEALDKLRQELEAGTKRISTDMLTGEVEIVGFERTAAAAAGWQEACAIRGLEKRGWAEKSLKAAGITKKKFRTVGGKSH